jgi:hypothetical protein
MTATKRREMNNDKIAKKGNSGTVGVDVGVGASIGVDVGVGVGNTSVEYIVKEIVFTQVAI